MTLPPPVARKLAAAIALVGWATLLLQLLLSPQLSVRNGTGLAHGVLTDLGLFTFLTTGGYRAAFHVWSVRVSAPRARETGLPAPAGAPARGCSG